MKTLDALITKLKEAKEDLSKGVNASYSSAPNMGKGDTVHVSMEDEPNSLQQSEAEPHKDDPHHEAKEKVKAKKIKEEAEDLLDMHKADKESHSVFSMEHAHKVLTMPHHEAKAHLHAVVDASSAKPENKTKIKAAINGSRGVKDLSSMVSNHVLAAGGGGSKTGELKVLKFDQDDDGIEMEKMCLHKNGQWSIEKK